MTLPPPTGKIYWDEIVEWDIKINKMKAYTDLGQSKKLSEILPIESADHHYVRKVQDSMGKPVDGKWSVPKYGNPNSSHADYRVLGFTNYETIPCWSLAALFGVLPEINGVNLKFERVKAEDGYDGYYYHIEYENKILIPYSKNPVDACVEMIIKLYEQKIL